MRVTAKGLREAIKGCDKAIDLLLAERRELEAMTAGGPMKENPEGALEADSRLREIDAEVARVRAERAAYRLQTIDIRIKG